MATINQAATVLAWLASVRARATNNRLPHQVGTAGRQAGGLYVVGIVRTDNNSVYQLLSLSRFLACSSPFRVFPLRRRHYRTTTHRKVDLSIVRSALLLLLLLGVVFLDRANTPTPPPLTNPPTNCAITTPSI